ncbi:MAG: MATE family efflux transporter [Clostridia bacterium]|nr:MATE family efflux transporter [Clostridia bacterium]
MTEQRTDFLGTEKLSKLMLKFSIPCILSLLISSLYNIVDQIFIGNSELSTLGNAATGAVFPIFIIAQAFAWCNGDGCAAYLNICQGRKDDEAAKKSVGSGISLTFLSGLLLMLLFYPFKREFLILFGASENSLAYAIEYLDIILAFLPIYMLTNMMHAVLRADGSQNWTMLSTLVGAVINIILDPIFIFVFHWGMAGAAWATAIGQVTSFAIAVFALLRAKSFRLTWKSLIPNFQAFKGALLLGLSTFFIQLTIVIMAVLCNMMLAKYGAQSQFGADIPIAIISIQSKVFTIIINLVVGIALGCQPIISYNMGAKKYDRVKALYRNILLCTIVIGIFATLLFEIAPRAVIGLFGAPTNIPNPEDYWLFGERTFRIFMMFISFTCLVKMSSIFFQAVGRPIESLSASIVRDLICFTPLIVILPKFMGIDGILVASPIADGIALLIALATTIPFFHTLRKQEGTGEETVTPSISS